MKSTITRGLLAVVRALLALVAILQVITVLPALTWLQAPANITAEMAFALLIKVVVGAAAIAGYIWLTKVSNRQSTQAA